MGDIDHDEAGDLQRFLRDKDQKWLRLPLQAGHIKLPQIHLHHTLSEEQDDISIDLNSEDSPYKLVPSLLPYQLFC